MSKEPTGKEEREKIIDLCYIEIWENAILTSYKGAEKEIKESIRNVFIAGAKSESSQGRESGVREALEEENKRLEKELWQISLGPEGGDEVAWSIYAVEKAKAAMEKK